MCYKTGHFYLLLTEVAMSECAVGKQVFPDTSDFYLGERGHYYLALTQHRPQLTCTDPCQPNTNNRGSNHDPQPAGIGHWQLMAGAMVG